jgi:hypothetical protein
MSSLSTYFGVAISMGLAIGCCVIGKISEGSLNLKHILAATLP